MELFALGVQISVKHFSSKASDLGDKIAIWIWIKLTSTEDLPSSTNIHNSDIHGY